MRWESKMNSFQWRCHVSSEGKLICGREVQWLVLVIPDVTRRMFVPLSPFTTEITLAPGVRNQIKQYRQLSWYFLAFLYLPAWISTLLQNHLLCCYGRRILFLTLTVGKGYILSSMLLFAIEGNLTAVLFVFTQWSCLLFSQIIGEVSELQEKAKKEGILKNDNEPDDTKTRSDDNFEVWNLHLWILDFVGTLFKYQREIIRLLFREKKRILALFYWGVRIHYLRWV